MSSLKELLDQRSVLEKQIADLQNTERTEAIAKVRALMAEYGLTAADLARGATRAQTKAPGKGAKIAAKYRDPVTGETWSGRGLKPKWLQAALAKGKTLADFAV